MVDVTFVTGVAVVGFNNGVVNLALNTAQFLPEFDEYGKPTNKVELAEIIAANLRMDLMCAQMLRDSLTRIIDANTKPSAAKEVN